jgi:hypothetical protein
LFLELRYLDRVQALFLSTFFKAPSEYRLWSILTVAVERSLKMVQIGELFLGSEVSDTPYCFAYAFEKAFNIQPFLVAQIVSAPGPAAEAGPCIKHGARTKYISTR